MNFNTEAKVFPNFIKTKPALDDNHDDKIFSTTENRSFPKELLFSQATGLVSKKFSKNIRKKLLTSYNLDGFIEEMESHETFDKPYVSDLAFDNVGELFVSASTSGVIEIFNFYQYLQSSHRFRRSTAYKSTIQELQAAQLQASQIRSKKRKREYDDDEHVAKRPKSESIVRMQRLLDLYNRPTIANEDKENNQNLFNLRGNSNQNSATDIIYDDIMDVDEPTPKETFQAKSLQRQITALQERLKFKYTEPSITYQTRYKASSVRWSPANQDLMFTGFLNYNKIFVYDIALDIPDPVGQFSTPGSGTNDLAFLPNRENGVFAGGRDGVLRMYDQNSQFDRPSMSFTAPNQANAINSIEPAIDGNKIYLVHPDSSATIWDIRIAQRPVDVLSMTSIMFKAIYPVSRPGQLLSIKSVPYDDQLLAVGMGNCSGILNLVTKQFKSCGLLKKDTEATAGESFLRGRSGFYGDLFYTTDPRHDTITYYDFPTNRISKPFASVRASGNITATARHPKFNFVLAGLDDNSTDVLGAVHSEVQL